MYRRCLLVRKYLYLCEEAGREEERGRKMPPHRTHTHTHTFALPRDTHTASARTPAFHTHLTTTTSHCLPRFLRLLHFPARAVAHRARAAAYIVAHAFALTPRTPLLPYHASLRAYHARFYGCLLPVPRMLPPPPPVVDSHLLHTCLFTVPTTALPSCVLDQPAPTLTCLPPRWAGPPARPHLPTPAFPSPVVWATLACCGRFVYAGRGGSVWLRITFAF